MFLPFPSSDLMSSLSSYIIANSPLVMSPAAASAPPAKAARAENPTAVKSHVTIAVRFCWRRRRRWYSGRGRERQEAVVYGDALKARGIDVGPVSSIAVRLLCEVASTAGGGNYRCHLMPAVARCTISSLRGCLEVAAASHLDPVLLVGTVDQHRRRNLLRCGRRHNPWGIIQMCCEINDLEEVFPQHWVSKIFRGFIS